MKLYIMHTACMDDPADHKEWESSLPAGSWERSIRYVSLEDRKNAAGAGWLLQYVFRQEGIPFQPESIFRGKHGKPYHERVYFNISHSGQYVICATGQVDIGCDIQQIKKCHDRLVYRFFSPEEQDYVFSGEGRERDERFIRIWTRKESYFKETGEGLTKNLQQYCFLSGAGFYETKIGDYMICISSAELRVADEVRRESVPGKTLVAMEVL